MEKIHSKKAMLIPGFMGVLSFYRYYHGYDFWKRAMRPDDLMGEIDCEYLIGHSLGNHVAILNWEKNRNCKLILVNPLLIRKSLFDFFWRQVKFLIFEGPSRRHDFILNPVTVAKDFRTCVYYLRKDLASILDNIPKSDIVVIRGKKDHFFCDDEAADYIKSKGIELIELDDVGHNWYPEIDEEIRKLISVQ